MSNSFVVGLKLLKNVDDSSMEVIKSQLTFNESFEDNHTIITSYYEADDSIYVPRYYRYKNIKGSILSSPGVALYEPQLTSKLRDPQKEVLSSILSSENGTIAVLPCGFGKTLIGIALAASRRVRTAVLVDSVTLSTQWKSEIEKHSNMTCKIVQGKDRDVNADIVIIMAQSIMNNPLSLDQTKSFGMTIVDECDRFSSNKFNKVIGYFPSKYRLGLTATLDKNSQRFKIFSSHLGDICHFEDTWINKPTILHLKTNVRIDLPFRRKFIAVKKQVKNKNRNDLIISLIRKLLSEGRSILFLSEYIDHLEELSKSFTDVVLFYGSDEKEKIPDGARLIFATFSKAARGVSLEHIDTVILGTSRADTIQACGRCVRKVHERTPYVVDLVDSGPYAEGLWKARKQKYEKHGFKIASLRFGAH